ncbi:TMV resistance protein N-like [Neltuma alba]|uniref:TMV resistance protein N-like n=1 Tax=Neltuma alba TaxID=207710 RepID=UPI0010A3B953|nr:TMV resistance protein N-like [Prosopis alba]
MMRNLDEGESIELFNWHAFKQESPRDDFIKLSRKIVAYCGGLPLALEVLGSHLFGRGVEKWKCVFKKLKEIPNNKIHKKLKISYDGLDELEQEIFLDICCFFIGMDRHNVTQILDGCKFFADIGIETLVERSLIAIDEKNKFVMHDLLRDMGREVIRQQSKMVPGNRSRLWFHKEARAVLSKHMGTETIEGLSLNLSQSKKKHFQTEAFKMMNKLRLLHLDDVQLKGDYNYISKNLRWLCWHGFPLKYIPSNFYQKKLVAIDLENSNLRKVWKESQILKMLKILNLGHSPHLRQTPDFSKLPNLEKLILKDCPSLSMLHDSIGQLHKLFLLDLEDCVGLHSLPRSIYRLKCLKTLILSGCLNIEKLEEDIEQMESLTTLVAPTIKKVPYSLVRLKSIFNLSVNGHEGLARCVIPSLYQSWMSPTNNPLPRTNCMDISGLNLAKYSGDCILPGDIYPYWLTFKGEGASVKFELPPVNGHDHLKGMTICFAYIPSGDLENKASGSCIICLMIINYTKASTLLYTEDKLKSLEEAEMKEIISNLKPNDQVEVKAVFGDGFTVKKTVVYLMYSESFDEQMEPSTSEAVNLSGTKHKCEEEEEEEAYQSTKRRKATKFLLQHFL